MGAYYKNKGFLGFKKDNLQGFLDKCGNLIIQTIYSSINEFKLGVTIVSKGDFYFILNTNGSEIAVKDVTKVSNFSFRLAKFKRNNRCGFLDKTGKVIIEPTFKDANDFGEEVATVRNENGKIDIINLRGEIIAKTNQVSLTEFKSRLTLTSSQ